MDNSLPDTATSWAMVRDNVTDLIWEVKTDDGSIHDKDNTYTWQNAQDVFIQGLNDEAFGGFSDWRMPTVKELSFIVNNGRSVPAIDTDYFPNTMSSSYWSSTTHAYYTVSAWSVYFYDGHVDGHDKSYALYVRAVRGGQSGSFDYSDISAWPNPHNFGNINVGNTSVAQSFIITNNGTADLVPRPRSSVARNGNLS